jgi:hypothetical protein
MNNAMTPKQKCLRRMRFIRSMRDLGYTYREISKRSGIQLSHVRLLHGRALRLGIPGYCRK